METKKTSFQNFRDAFSSLGCFSVHQIKAWNEHFDRNNLGRWKRQGKILRLRQGYYAFPSLRKNGDASFYIANRMYAPSYVSLHSALSFYGMIPEGIVQITSITARKTASFENSFGQYSYHTVKPELMFGYYSTPAVPGTPWSTFLAFPEKALLDLLYLNPQYRTENDIRELRFDGDFLSEELDITRLTDYLARFDSKALSERINLVKRIYL